MKKQEQLPDSVQQRIQRMARRTWGRLWITYAMLATLCAILIVRGG